MDTAKRGNVRVERGPGGRFKKRSTGFTEIGIAKATGADTVKFGAAPDAGEAPRISAGPDTAEKISLGPVTESPANVQPVASLDALAAEAAALASELPGAAATEAAAPGGEGGAVTVQVSVAMTADTLRKILKAISDNKMRRDPLTPDELTLLADVWEKPLNQLYEEMMRWVNMTPEQMGKWGPAIAAATVTVGIALPRVLNRIFMPAEKTEDGVPPEKKKDAAPAPVKPGSLADAVTRL